MSPTRSALKKQTSYQPDSPERKSPNRQKSVRVDTNKDQVFVFHKKEEDWDDEGQMMFIECQKRDMRGMYLQPTASKSLKFTEPRDYLTFKQEVEY